MKDPKLARYSSSTSSRYPVTEQAMWEEHQIDKGVVKYGSKHSSKRRDKYGSSSKNSTNEDDDKEYELLLEDQIDFVLADLDPGNINEKKKEVSLMAYILVYVII